MCTKKEIPSIILFIFSFQDTVTYSLISQVTNSLNVPGSYFYVEPHNGEILLRKSLKNSTYNQFSVSNICYITIIYVKVFSAKLTFKCPFCAKVSSQIFILRPPNKLQYKIYAKLL